MDTVTKPGAHAREAGRRDHLWVLFIIAGCALIEVWASWVLIGGMSGFPKIGGAHGVPTDWTLAVTSEAYWGYALYSWLAGASGPRSRRFAMWSFGAVFILSLIGQGASHLVPQGAKPSAVLVVFVTSLPVLVLALIAVLVHLRQLDREEAAEVAEDNALRSALDAARAARDAAQEELAGARAELAEVTAKAEALTRKLASVSTPKSRRGSGAKRGASSRANKAPASAPNSGAGSPPEEVGVATEFEAVDILKKEPGISGSELGRRLNVSERYGQILKNRYGPVAAAQTGEQPAITERAEG
jgi:hypothetical protein